MFFNPFDKKPDFINEEGSKWWKDKSTTDYAQKKDIHGIKLNILCFFVETKEGYRTRVLINRDSEVIYENQQLEAVATHIDMRKILKRKSK